MMLLFSGSDTFSFFFFNDTATTEIYTLSLHDALPISIGRGERQSSFRAALAFAYAVAGRAADALRIGDECIRSEEHTSELQSRSDLVCRLLLEKKKSKTIYRKKLLCLYVCVV